MSDRPDCRAHRWDEIWDRKPADLSIRRSRNVDPDLDHHRHSSAVPPRSFGNSSVRTRPAAACRRRAVWEAAGSAERCRLCARFSWSGEGSERVIASVLRCEVRSARYVSIAVLTPLGLGAAGDGVGEGNGLGARWERLVAKAEVVSASSPSFGGEVLFGVDAQSRGVVGDGQVGGPIPPARSA